MGNNVKNSENLALIRKTLGFCFFNECSFALFVLFFDVHLVYKWRFYLNFKNLDCNIIKSILAYSIIHGLGYYL